MDDRSYPKDIGAEKSVLGSMFLTRYALLKGIESLSKEMFYLESNQTIFDALCYLEKNKIPVDLTTISSELDRRKVLKQIGVEYLTELINYVPTAANIDEYIKIVEEKYLLRNLIDEATNIVNESYNSKKEVKDILDDAEKNILKVVKVRKGSEFRPINEVVENAHKNLNLLSQNGGAITGIETGYKAIDKITAGLHENDLIIVAARPAMGKTAFALNLATNMAINSKKTVAVFNMEMPAEQLVNRMFSSIGEVDQSKLRVGNLDNDDWEGVNEAIVKLSESKLYIDDTPGLTVSDIRAKCRRLYSSKDGLDVVIIDYLQLISGKSNSNVSRQQEVSEISRSLKTMAMELKIPVIALAQLSRQVESREDKRPQLSDLRESGSIEQDADLVAFLYREDYYKKEVAIDEFTSLSEFIIAKHRSGPTGTIKLSFRRKISKFEPWIDENKGGL